VSPAAGRQVLLNTELPVPNCNVPFESTLTLLKVWSYRVYANGRVTEVKQSSQWLPVSSVPGTIVAVPGAYV